MSSRTSPARYGTVKNFRSQSFKDRSKTAAFWEAWTASVLSREGLYVLHMPWNIAETEDQATMFLNSIDLEVSSVFPDIMTDSCWDHTPVEVKAQSQRFTRPADYPFSEPLVCSQNSWLRKAGIASHTPTHYLYVSMASGAILWLPKGSLVSLGHETLDHKRNELYKTVKTSKGLLRSIDEFVKLVKEES